MSMNNYTLNESNYYSVESNLCYFSVSQFKSFMKCEATALAEVRGEWEREETDSLLVGSYVDASICGTLDEFKSSHPQLLKRDGALKSQYLKADELVHRIQRDEVLSKALGGAHQVIKTGELFGYPWKIKIDSYHVGSAIVDLKVMRDLGDVYVEGEGRLPFIEAWGYDIQGAVYQAIEGNRLPFYLAVITKEKVPDIALYQIPQWRLDMALKIVEHNIDRFAEIKEGLIRPTRCEKCDYCKSTKVLTGPTIFGEEDK